MKFLQPTIIAKSSFDKIGSSFFFNKKKKNHLGFSLIELLLYMGLFSVLVLVVLEIFVTTLEIETRGWSDSVTAQEGQYLLTRLAYDLRRADQVLEPASFGVQSDSLRLDIGGQEILYQLVGDQLILDDGTSSFELHSPACQVSNIAFTKIGDAQELVSVKFNFEIGSPDEQRWGKSHQFDTTVGLRN